MSKWGLLVILCLLLPLPVFAQVGGAGSGGGSALNSVGEALFTSSGTWTVPSGVSTIVLTGCGGGGGGAGGHTADPGGGGGGGSSAVCVSTMPVMVTPGATLTITIGGGGNGGAAGANGSPGLDTTIAGTTLGTIIFPGTLFNATFGTAANGGSGGRNHMLTSSAVGGTGAGASAGADEAKGTCGDAWRA